MKRIVKIISGLFVAYLLLLLYPTVLFFYTSDHGQFHVYSDKEIPIEIEMVLADVEKRIVQSELYDSLQQFNIFICNDQWRFLLFGLHKNAGGVCLFTTDSYLMTSDIPNNHLAKPMEWRAKNQDRPLSYFIAHELIHAMQFKDDLIKNYFSHEIREGYADYIAKAPDFNFQDYHQMYLDQDSTMNPSSGFYKKYHLYVAQLMDNCSMSYQEVLEVQLPLDSVLQSIE